MGHLSRNQTNSLLVLCTMCEKCLHFISANTRPKTKQQTHQQSDKYRVIRNDFRGCNDLSYTIHLRLEYVVAPMDLEVHVPPLLASIPELKV